MAERWRGRAVEWLADAGRAVLVAGVCWMGIDMAGAQAPVASSAAAAVSATALCTQRCADCDCDCAQRIGGPDPALLPESLSRPCPDDVLQAICQGRVSMQTPGHAEALAKRDAAALAASLHTPVWSEASILASHHASPTPVSQRAQPLWSADPMKLFLVVEGGDHHVSLLDGDTFEVVNRFPSRCALQGEPQFTPDGRHVFLGSRDGWITKYDLWRLRVVAEVRAGLNLRKVALSGDGRWVMAANDLPRSLVLFDADLNLKKSYAAATLDGRQTSRIAAVQDAAPRQSFVVALMDIPELWEIAYDPRASPIYDGLVHDYRMGEAIAKPGFLGVRRTPLDEPLSDFFLDQSGRNVLGTIGHKSDAGAATGEVINLDVRRKIADVPMIGMPRVGSAITFVRNGTTVLVSPNLKDSVVDVIDMKTWKPVATIPTPGPGCHVRSHEKTPYAWVDSMVSPSGKDSLTIIHKATLEAVASVRKPGRALAHIGFTNDGRYALVGVREMDGALIVLDAATFEEVRRLPMSKPTGQYNAWNKITRSERTSH